MDANSHYYYVLTLDKYNLARVLTVSGFIGQTITQQYNCIKIEMRWYNSLITVDSHSPTKVIQEVTSCSVADAQSFNCNGFKEIPGINVCIFLQLARSSLCLLGCSSDIGNQPIDMSLWRPNTLTCRTAMEWRLYHVDVYHLFGMTKLAFWGQQLTNRLKQTSHSGYYNDETDSDYYFISFLRNKISFAVTITTCVILAFNFASHNQISRKVFSCHKLLTKINIECNKSLRQTESFTDLFYLT